MHVLRADRAVQRVVHADAKTVRNLPVVVNYIIISQHDNSIRRLIQSIVLSFDIY